ncbi:MBOAT, membrane-bound O-acyltransferase family-domain-containing protein [Zychaea mexicana]|uniref:MBOAT, membrane-bound O-acyltransferase family-domain-containing protein n=1 Tax=Zychaea mexicana TaxID=64656 RepID=UPI0022FE53A9|nr:MBOAT, membrane-bound O-acyltransferase family-domain-containing protein [Zychaea mexicana]KAI9495203.1 MBOAT, membrane-bound O-acyltransferase family-domain-containing protein [Zychaea mexicana]
MPFLTSAIAYVSGVPEPTLRLLVTLGLAYPIARVYNQMYIRGKGPVVSAATVTERNLFILLAGLALALFFSGSSIYHSLLTVCASYGFLYLNERFMPNNRFYGAAAVWGFNAVYLLAGYYITATDDYDVTWTMPQCILCLRLMGFGFDYYDGATSIVKVEGPEPTKKAEETTDHTTTLRPTEQTKPPNQLPLSFALDTPLASLPDFSQVLAYCYFPSAFLVGPQFSFSLYRRWLASSPLQEGSAVAQEEAEKDQMRYVFRCLGLAVVYLAIQQGVGGNYPTSYLLTDEFASLCFLRRIWIFIITGKFVYNKYIGVWMLTEGACAYFGISYDGEDSRGNRLFGGLANALPAIYETATSIDHIIGSFNINTNLWVKYYVFKRLRFLGNKQLSQFGALGFLAIWHGFHINYFTTFFCEFAVTHCEAVLRKRLLPCVQTYTSKNALALAAWKVVAWVTCNVALHYCVIQFDLLKLSKAWVAYKNVYFVGHIILFAIFALDAFVLKRPVRTPKEKVK